MLPFVEYYGDFSPVLISLTIHRNPVRWESISYFYFIEKILCLVEQQAQAQAQPPFPPHVCSADFPGCGQQHQKQGHLPLNPGLGLSLQLVTCNMGFCHHQPQTLLPEHSQKCHWLNSVTCSDQDKWEHCKQGAPVKRLFIPIEPGYPRSLQPKTAPSCFQ